MDQRPNHSETKSGGRRKRPRYRLVADTLRHQLSRGGFSPGGKLPPIRDLASKFRVSVVTITRALRVLEREGQLTRVPAVGTFAPIPTALGPAITRQTTIAFATIELEGALTSRLATAVEEACRQRGWALQIYNAQQKPSVEAETLARLPESQARGAIILPVADESNIEALFRLRFLQFPFVLLDRRVPGLQADLVESDHERGGYLATRHLLGRGHRVVRILTSVPGTWSSADARTRGYERALLEHGVAPRPEWRLLHDPGSYTQDSETEPPWRQWYKVALPALRRMVLPTAFFTLNYYAARGLIEVCRELGLQIPRDVSVVSFDDTEFLQACQPAITVIAQRARQIGQTAVDLLEQRLQGTAPSKPQNMLIDVDLVERDSVRRLEMRAATAGERPGID